ncbi:MAG: ADOP family duplicated permease [Puniceicoccaceae bacterium]
MDRLLRDLNYGLRQLLKHPMLSLVSIAALGLGISGVTTQISAVNGMFFKGLPFPDSHRIAHLERINVERDNFNAEVPMLEFAEWQKEQEVFEGVSGFYTGTANLTIGNTVERYDGSFISANAFEQLRVTAAMGRGLVASDDLPGSPDVIVLSHKVWVNDLGMDPDIVGKNATLNGRSVTIVGVMPEGFEFPVRDELWVPLFQQQDLASLSWGEPMMTLEVFGRLKDGVSMETARASMATLARNLETTYPDTNKGYRDVLVQPFIKEYLGGDTSALMYTMLLITILILVIACANVANLLMARSMRRQKEFAIRSSLGASRQNIIRQFLTESILLSAFGTLLALILTYLDLRKIKELLVEMTAPFWMDFSLDWRVLVVTILVTVFTGISAGMLPALRASKLNVNEILKDDSRTSSSLRIGIFSKSLVVLQISVAAVILTLVVLFVKSVNNAISIDYAYDPDSVMTTRIGLFEEVYPDEESRAIMVNTLIERLQARPEIDIATSSTRYMFLDGPGTRYELPDKVYPTETDREFARFQQVSPNFFEAVKLPILQGRDFLPEDYNVAYPRFAIVNRVMAERDWPGESPIGKLFKPEMGIGDIPEEELPMLEVIGITESMQENGVFEDHSEDGGAFFVPQVRQAIPRFITIIVSGKGDPQALIPVIREEMAGLDRNLPLYAIGTPRKLNEQGTVQFSYFASVFTQFGVLATFLAAVGIYGVITFSVNQRITEFGIRQALGATRSAVFKLVYTHAMKQLGLGFFVAIAILSPLTFSEGVRESLSIFFYKIDQDSLGPYFLSFGFVTLIAVLAAAPPALKAARIQPSQALRYE